MQEEDFNVSSKVSNDKAEEQAWQEEPGWMETNF